MASVWRRQTFSAAVESCTPDMSLTILHEQVPELMNVLNGKIPASGGVSILDRDVVRASYTTSNSALTHNWITAVARVDSEWFVGTYGGGVFRLDSKGVWHGFTDLNGRGRIKRMAESLGISIDLQFPDGGRAVAEAADQGTPLGEAAPKNGLRREIVKLAKSIHEVNLADAAPQKARARA